MAGGQIQKVLRDLQSDKEKLKILALMYVPRIKDFKDTDTDTIRYLVQLVEDCTTSTNPDISFLSRKALNNLKDRIPSRKEESLQAPAREEPVQETKPTIQDPVLTTSLSLNLKGDPQEILDLLRALPGDFQDYQILVDLLNHEDERIRASAIERVSQFAPETVQKKELAPFLASESNRIRANAVVALGRIDPELVSECLQGMLNTTRISFRESAVWAISQLEPSEVFKGFLLKCLHDPYRDVRLRAIDSLRGYPHADVIMQMRRLQNDLDIDICEKSQEVLKVLQENLDSISRQQADSLLEENLSEFIDEPEDEFISIEEQESEPFDLPSTPPAGLEREESEDDFDEFLEESEFIQVPQDDSTTIHIENDFLEVPQQFPSQDETLAVEEFAKQEDEVQPGLLSGNEMEIEGDPFSPGESKPLPDFEVDEWEENSEKSPPSQEVLDPLHPEESSFETAISEPMAETVSEEPPKESTPEVKSISPQESILDSPDREELDPEIPDLFSMDDEPVETVQESTVELDWNPPDEDEKELDLKEDLLPSRAVDAPERDPISDQTLPEEVISLPVEKPTAPSLLNPAEPESPELSDFDEFEDQEIEIPEQQTFTEDLTAQSAETIPDFDGFDDEPVDLLEPVQELQVEHSSNQDQLSNERIEPATVAASIKRPPLQENLSNDPFDELLDYLEFKKRVANLDIFELLRTFPDPPAAQNVFQEFKATPLQPEAGFWLSKPGLKPILQESKEKPVPVGETGSAQLKEKSPLPVSAKTEKIDPDIQKVRIQISSLLQKLGMQIFQGCQEDLLDTTPTIENALDQIENSKNKIQVFSNQDHPDNDKTRKALKTLQERVRQSYIHLGRQSLQEYNRGKFEFPKAQKVQTRLQSLVKKLKS